MSAKTVPDVQRLFISEHLFMEVCGLAEHMREMGEPAPVSIGMPVANAKGLVVLSGYTSALYADLYHGWNSVSRKAMADGAREITETLWFNDRAWFNMPQGVLL
ncbi:MAG: hypothetical protein M0R80_26105 [Proteobacteria bacterium]|jgi:hypothetical protein|nr:hypothetical protein [Pseudomonadota bacterium]